MNQQNRLNQKNNLSPKAGTNQKSLNRFGAKNAASPCSSQTGAGQSCAAQTGVAQTGAEQNGAKQPGGSQNSAGQKSLSPTGGSQMNAICKSQSGKRLGAAGQTGAGLKNNLILCGFMGSGKSTVGRLLARRLNRPFIDLDEFIEQQTGQTVTEIFNTRGEDAFRALEREAARSLCSQSGLVLSCGGGTVLNPQTAALLKQSGTVIYLKVRPQTVLQRLKGDQTRPLLQGTEAEKKSRVCALLAEREPFYKAAAELTVSTNNGAEQAVLDILNQTGLI